MCVVGGAGPAPAGRRPESVPNSVIVRESLRVSDSTMPSRRRTTRRAHSAMSFSCVTMMIVLPERFSARSVCMISTLVFVSRFPVGSSPRMRCGSFTRLRAIATRCCWPPDSCNGRWSSRSPRPTISARATQRAFVLSSSLIWYSSGSSTFSTTVYCGSRLYDWKMNPRYVLRTSDSWSSAIWATSTSPRK